MPETCNIIVWHVSKSCLALISGLCVLTTPRPLPLLKMATCKWAGLLTMPGSEADSPNKHGNHNHNYSEVTMLDDFVFSYNRASTLTRTELLLINLLGYTVSMPVTIQLLSQ